MRLDLITSQIAAAVATLDAEAYRQGRTTSVWRESSNPMDDPEGESIGHLSFSVNVRQSAITGAMRGMPGEIIRCKSAVEVVFQYRIRPTDQLTDNRLAMRAARDIVSLVNQETAWLSAAASDDDVVVTPRERFRPRYLLDEEPYAMVTVSFDIDHDEEI